MTVPPDEGPGSGPSSASEPEPPLDFDPYRFGKPEHPVPPEYAPPGYVPPTPPNPHNPWPPESPQNPANPQNAQVPPPPYPYGGSPPPPRPPYGPPYGPPRRGNTKGVVSLVLGVLAILLCWLSIWDLLFIVPAIVLGVIGRGDAARYPERGGRSIATSGLVCGIVAFVLAVATTVYIYNRVKPCLDQYGTTSKQFQTCATDRLLGRDS